MPDALPSLDFTCDVPPAPSATELPPKVPDPWREPIALVAGELLARHPRGARGTLHVWTDEQGRGVWVQAHVGTMPPRPPDPPKQAKRESSAARAARKRAEGALAAYKRAKPTRHLSGAVLVDQRDAAAAAPASKGTR